MNTLLRDVFACTPRKGRSRPKVLVFAFDFLSHYLRCMQLAAWCRNDVVFVFGHSRRYERWLKEGNWEVFDYDDTDAEVILEYSTRFDFSWMSETELERVLKQQIEIIEQHEPDFVLGDASMTLNMAAEYCGVPCIKIVNGYMSKYYACARPLPRVHPLYPLLRHFPQRLQQMCTDVGEAVLLRWTHRTFASLRQRYGLSKRATFLDELEGQTTLICDLPELFPQTDLPSSVLVVGPLFYHKAEQDEGVLHDIQSLLSSTKKNILVSLGSTGDVEHFQWLCHPDFAEYSIIVSGRNAAELRAPHVSSRSFINHNALLPHVDLLICHGGNGTIYQALAYGVPIVACTNFFEQEYNMQRVNVLGLGEDLAGGRSHQEYVRIVRHWANQKHSDAHQRIQNSIHGWIARYE